MRVIPLPKASGDKNGKVESNYHVMNTSLLHKLDGTTKSNVQKRGRYKSSENAIYSLDDVRYMVMRWVVDHHNRTKHTGTGEIPAERWRKGMDEVGPKPAPDKDIIAPLVGMVIPRKLRNDGVRYNNLRWNSNAFSALRDRIGPPFDVVIRIDPLDLRTAYVLDQDANPPAWIEGHLMAESKIEHYTLRQYEHLKKVVDDAAVVDDDYELKLAQGTRHLWNFVEGRRNQAGVIPKPVAAFIKDPDVVVLDRWILSQFGIGDAVETPAVLKGYLLAMPSIRLSASPPSISSGMPIAGLRFLISIGRPRPPARTVFASSRRIRLRRPWTEPSTASSQLATPRPLAYRPLMVGSGIG